MKEVGMFIVLLVVQYFNIVICSSSIVSMCLVFYILTH